MLTKDYSMIGDNCLHLMLTFRPTPWAVQLMMDQFRFATETRDPELSVDFLGRTPLHVALDIFVHQMFLMCSCQLLGGSRL